MNGNCGWLQKFHINGERFKIAAVEDKYKVSSIRNEQNLQAVFEKKIRKCSGENTIQVSTRPILRFPLSKVKLV